MSPKSSAARIAAQTTTGYVVVVADSSTIGSSSALPDAAWIAARIHQDLGDTPEGASMNFPPGVLELFACPRCQSRLRLDDAESELVCTGPDCGLAYPIRNGIPVLLVDEARPKTAADPA